MVAHVVVLVSCPWVPLGSLLPFLNSFSMVGASALAATFSFPICSPILVLRSLASTLASSVLAQLRNLYDWFYKWFFDGGGPALAASAFSSGSPILVRLRWPRPWFSHRFFYFDARLESKFSNLFSYRTCAGLDPCFSHWFFYFDARLESKFSNLFARSTC